MPSRQITSDLGWHALTALRKGVARGEKTTAFAMSQTVPPARFCHLAPAIGWISREGFTAGERGTAGCHGRSLGVASDLGTLAANRTGESKHSPVAHVGFGSRRLVARRTPGADASGSATGSSRTAAVLRGGPASLNGIGWRGQEALRMAPTRVDMARRSFRGRSKRPGLRAVGSSRRPRQGHPLRS